MNAATYKSAVKPTWCPGCGDFGVLAGITQALAEMEWEPENVVAVSGIGCSSRFPFFLSTYGFHSVHGRAVPVAIGVRIARPDLKVLVFGGDGDGFAIGGGHFLHGARRNVDLTYVIMDNHIYGLTKGQTSPTSDLQFKTKSTPYGSVEPPINPVQTAICSGATYVARGFSGDPKGLKELFVGGMRHKGFAMIDVLSPCVTYNRVDTFKSFKERLAETPADHDRTDLASALALATDPDRYFTGVLFEVERPVLEDRVEALKGPSDRHWTDVVESVFDAMS